MSNHTDDHSHDLSETEIRDRIWTLAADIDFCMLTTWTGEKQRSRPLSARVDREAHAIYFLVDADGGKNDEIARYPAVSLAWADNGAHNYAVISGEAKVSNDRAKIKELWTKMDRAWWDDENDPDIRLLTVRPEEGEMWQGPSGPIATVKMLAAAVTGGDIDFGDTGRARL